MNRPQKRKLIEPDFAPSETEEGLRETVRRLSAENLRLREKAYQDPLTGLANRWRLEEALNLGQLGAMVLCDLDDLHGINHRHGHSAGDDVISGFAEVLVANSRAAQLPVRLGGDEFVTVFFGVVSLVQVEDYIGWLESGLAELNARRHGLPAINVTIGYALASGPDRFDDLYRIADERMMSGKATSNR